LGAITRARLHALRESDAILREEFDKAGLTSQVWQFFTVVPDFTSTGVKDGKRLDYWPVIIRAVNTVDAMVCTVPRIDWEVLETITNRILNEVDGVCRVCGARQDETTTMTTAATTAPTVNTTPADTTTRAEGTVAAADPTATVTVTAIGPAVTTVPDSQWTVAEAQSAAQEARRAVEAMRVAKDHFKAACNAADPVQKMRSIQAAQEQVKTARAHIVTVAGYCAENVSVPLTGGAYATAADHIAAILSRCDTLTNTVVTEANAATLDLTLMTDAVTIMNECLQMQTHMTQLLTDLAN
jgi:hypothetical protein